MNATQTKGQTMTQSYYYWIGMRNAGGGLDSIGDTGYVEAESAQLAAEMVAEDRAGIDCCIDCVVCARSEDHADSGETTITE